MGKQHNAKYEVNFKQGKDDVEKYDLDAHCRKQVSKLGTQWARKFKKVQSKKTRET